MKKGLIALFSAACLMCACGGNEAQKNDNNSGNNEGADTVATITQVYLCFGQSNMAGSTEIEDCDKTCSDRLIMLPTMDNAEKGRKLGVWSDGTAPQSGSGSGLSPADYFGRTMVENLPENVKVGLVTVAIGGCDIRIFDKDIYGDYLETYTDDWFVGRVADYGKNPYGRLIEVAKIAQQEGEICGIILHQGETNTGDALWPTYVKKIYESMLSDLSLSAENVPLIAGEVVPESANGVCASMNEIIATLPSVIPTAKVISGEGCGVRDDNIHYNSEGVRELGRRYAAAMLEAKGLK